MTTADAEPRRLQVQLADVNYNVKESVKDGVKALLALPGRFRNDLLTLVIIEVLIIKYIHHTFYKSYN